MLGTRAFRGLSRLPRLTFALLLAGSLALSSRPVLAANGTVGSGNAASCTEAAFDTVFYAVQTSGGGVITFNCGAAPHIILFSTQKPVTTATELRGGDLITLSGNNTTSLFQVQFGHSLSLNHITLARGYGATGAVENFGTLVVDGSRIENSIATGSGGAIATYGALSLSNSMITGNSAASFGGGIVVEGGSATVVNSQVSANTAAEGGGISAAATTDLAISGSQFAGNRVTAVFGQGGGVRSDGTLLIGESTFTGNGSSRGGALSVMGGTATVTRSTIRDNWAAYGGGIRQEAGNLTLNDVALFHNGYASNGSRLTTGGGALSWSAGIATLTNVTISGNWASYGGGFDHADGFTTLTNVTMSGNAAIGGGAIDQGGGSIDLNNATVAGNAAPFFAGGIASRAGNITLRNTLLTGNINPDNNQRTNCSKPLTGFFSLSGDFSCGFGAGRDNVALPLGPLRANGGFTKTHLPGRGSPAIDAGTGAACPPTDQRGVARPQGGACDVGAVEVTSTDLLALVYLPLTLR